MKDTLIVIAVNRLYLLLTIKMKKITFPYLLPFILFFVSCNSNRIYDEYKEIPEYIWHKNYIAPFEIQIPDTNSEYNIYINIRHTSAYQYKNIWLKIFITFPEGEKNNELIELMLAEESGKWLGSGMGDIWDNSILVKERVRFPVSGKYKFEFQQYMRQDRLPFIMDVGIAIEKYEING